MNIRISHFVSGSDGCEEGHDLLYVTCIEIRHINAEKVIEQMLFQRNFSFFQELTLSLISFALSTLTRETASLAPGQALRFPVSNNR